MDRAITDLLDAPSPVVTTILDTRSDQPAAAQQLALRWRNVRRRLEGAGADEATLSAVDQELDAGGLHPGGSSLLLVAGGGQVLLSRHLPDPPAGDLDQGFVGPIPHLVPLVQAEQAAIPHVVVLADRVGADLFGMTGPAGRAGAQHIGGEDAVEVTVDGDTENIQRSAPGGWSQRRFQQRSENTWERNAGDAADEVVALADELGAQLILVGGDERATTYLIDALPERLQPRTRRLESGSRAEGASIEHLSEEVGRQVRTAAAERLTAVLATLDEERGQHDRAAVGTAEVVAALQMATVETLLVHQSPDDDRTAWVGPEPVHLALDRTDLTAGMGVTDPVQASLVDACVRAALGTGAEVVVAPASKVRDGLAAILRHTGAMPSTPGQG